MPYVDPVERMTYQRRYQRERYQRLRGEHKSRCLQRKSEIKRWFAQYKAGLNCERCGEPDPACLEFHHKNPAEKEGLVSYMVAQAYSLTRIRAEIAKCEVLCSNCHRKHHAREFAESRTAFAYD